MTKEYLKHIRKESNLPYFHQESFINLIENVYGCKSEHLLLKENSGSLGVPLMRCQSFMFGKKLTSMPFNFYPPLLHQKDEVDHEGVFSHLIKITPNKYYLEYKTFDNLNPSFMEKYGIKGIQPSVVSELALKPTYEEQLKGYGKSLRQNIRTTSKKIVEHNVILKGSNDIDDLRDWYNLLVRLYRDKHSMIAQPYSLYEKLFSNEDTNWAARLFVAKKGNLVLGGIFIIQDQDHWEYSWAAFDSSHNKLGLNSLVVNFAIEKAIAEGAKSFGFGSSSPDDEKLIYFKSRWGCTSKPINYYYWNKTPKPVNLGESYGFAKSVIRKLPVFLLKRLPEYLVPKLA